MKVVFGLFSCSFQEMSHSFIRVPASVLLMSKWNAMEWISLYRQNCAVSLYLLFLSRLDQTQSPIYDRQVLCHGASPRRNSLQAYTLLFTQFIIFVYLTSFPSTILAVMAASESTLGQMPFNLVEKIRTSLQFCVKTTSFYISHADRVTGFSSFPWIVLTSCTGGLSLRTLA